MELKRKNILFFILLNILLFAYICNFKENLQYENILLFLEIFIAEFILKDMLYIDDYGESKILKILEKTHLDKVIYLLWVITFLLRVEIISINHIQLKIFLSYINECCFLVIFLKIILEITKEQLRISKKIENHHQIQ